MNQVGTANLDTNTTDFQFLIDNIQTFLDLGEDYTESLMEVVYNGRVVGIERGCEEHTNGG